MDYSCIEFLDAIISIPRVSEALDNAFGSRDEVKWLIIRSLQQEPGPWLSPRYVEPYTGPMVTTPAVSPGVEEPAASSQVEEPQVSFQIEAPVEQSQIETPLARPGIGERPPGYQNTDSLPDVGLYCGHSEIVLDFETVTQLKDQCRIRGLSVSGPKDALITRLREYFEHQSDIIAYYRYEEERHDDFEVIEEPVTQEYRDDFEFIEEGYHDDFEFIEEEYHDDFEVIEEPANQEDVVARDVRPEDGAVQVFPPGTETEEEEMGRFPGVFSPVNPGSAPPDCVICREDITDTMAVVTCGHHFHYVCIRTWLTEHVTCPMCRANVL